MVTFLHSLAEANGKTVKENNLAKAHNIQLLSLVEITSQDSELDYKNQHHQGIRLWVVSHTRDCDGTPLYTLSFNKMAKKEQDRNESAGKQSPVYQWTKGLCQGQLLHGYAEDSLLLISEPAPDSFGVEE